MDPFENVYRRHFGPVWTALRRLGVEHADLEDAVQDVFVVVYRRRGALAADASLRAWLLGISRRVASDHRRRRLRHLRRLDGLRWHEPGGAAPEDALHRFDAVRLLDRFLSSLDDGKREVFVLVELEQLTGREVAHILGLNRNTAVARLRAARQAFDAYAYACQRSPARLLGAARRAPAPEPAVRRRVLSAVLVRLGRGNGTIAPASGATLSASMGAWKAAIVGVALAGASLGTIALASAPAATPARIPSIEIGAPPSDAQQGEGPEGVAVVEPERPAPPPVPVAEGPSRLTVAPARPARAPIREGSRGVDPLEAQASALKQARAALRAGDPERASSIVTAALEAHPSEGLAVELALVRIGALCAQGLRAQALGEASVLRRQHPGSPMAARAGCPEPHAR